MPRDNVHHPHRAKPRLIRKPPPEVHAEQRRLDDELNRRFAKGFKHRHYRIGEPSRGERITGAVAITLVGITAGYFAGHFFGGPF